MGDNAFLIVLGVILVFPFVFYFLKVWLFATGTPGSTFHRVQRIAELDGHLPFEERLAEKLRLVSEEAAEAETPPHDPAAPSPSPFTVAPPGTKSFGRRGL
ncbi:MAG: hypothetical protein V4696_04830 [Pseudomonadota bacterium]